ncbi:glycosyltransferase family 9 protein [bacterium]|nr:glycosyltransferase family 9 protein [bacterium]
MNKKIAFKEINYQKFKILLTKSGQKTIYGYSPYEKKDIFLHSKFDPLAQSQKLIERYNLKGVKAILIFGFGLGYHIQNLITKAEKDAQIIIIEPEEELFKIALNEVDLSFIFEDKRTELLIGVNLEEITKLLQEKKDSNESLLIIENPPSINLNKFYFNCLYKFLSKSFPTIAKSKLLSSDDHIFSLMEGLISDWPVEEDKDLKYILDNRELSPQKILLIQLTAIGDIVQTTPVFLGLREKHPNSYLAFLTEQINYDLVKNNPYLNDIFIFDNENIKTSLRNCQNYNEVFEKIKVFLDQLREKNFDLVINLHLSLKSALLTKLSGSKDVQGINIDEYGKLIVTGQPWVHYKYFLYYGGQKKMHMNIINPVGLQSLSAGVNPSNKKPYLNISNKEIEEAKDLLKQYNLNKDRETIGFFIGASYPSHRWKEEYFAQLADLLISKRNSTVLLFGGTGESIIGNNILKLAKYKDKIINLAGKTSLGQLASLISLCNYMVVNDTGPGHMAGAITSCLCIAGPAWAGPFGHNHLAIVANIACAGCLKLECLEHTCMKIITPESAYIALSLLRKLKTKPKEFKKHTKILNSKIFKDIILFYVGMEKIDKLEFYHPLNYKNSHPEEISENIFFHSFLNIWELLKGKKNYQESFKGKIDFLFSPQEIITLVKKHYHIKENIPSVKNEIEKIAKEIEGIKNLSLQSIEYMDQIINLIHKDTKYNLNLSLIKEINASLVEIFNRIKENRYSFIFSCLNDMEYFDKEEDVLWPIKRMKRNYLNIGDSCKCITIFLSEIMDYL